MPTFGYTTIGVLGSVGGGEVGSKFVTPAAGTITKLTLYADPSGGTESVRVAVYSDVAGTPTTKLAESGSATALTGSPGWFDVSLNYAFGAGVTLWLIYRKDGGADALVNYDQPGDVADQSTFYNGGAYPTWSDPFGFGGFLDRKVSIYATYDVAATPFLGRIGTRRIR